MAELDKEKQDKVWSEMLLKEPEQADFKFVKDRIEQLKEARKEEQFGVEVEQIWKDADIDYQPHRLQFTDKRGNKKLIQDETKGWASTFQKIGTSNWQSDIAQPNPYKKIQTALAILVDQNPAGVFSPASEKYQATNELIKQLYQRSWEKARSKEQLKLFVFNLAKYGWACARTYPLRISRKVKNLVEYNQEDPSKSVYEEKDVIEYNDIFRENLDPWNVWVDDMALPNNPWSLRDWSWRKVYSMDKAEEEFGNWPNWKYVKPGGVTTDKIEEDKSLSKKYKEKDLIEIYFYENVVKDLFMVIANGIPLVISPLPISDTGGHKRLSLWQAYWNLRHAACIYGIGIYEAMRNNNQLYDMVSNMSIDQLVLSIYKMFFYQGTNALTDTGDIKIAPGVGKQTLDPKNIQFLEIPGPGAEAVNWRQLIRQDLDEDSGITDPLLGQITGKTAFEIAQAKESALKRLKTPLDNIADALNTEGYITVALMQILYSIPEIKNISDPDLIEAYMQEIESDPDLYQESAPIVDEFGERRTIDAKIYPEFPLNLEKDEKGTLVETKDTRFFRLKPESLAWEGIISIKSQSVLTPSKQLDKSLDLEMYQMIIPLLAQPREIYEKTVKNIVKLYDKDPKDVLPDDWLSEPLQQLPQEEQPLIVSNGQLPQQQQQMIQQSQMAQMNPGQAVQPRAQGIISKISSKLGNLNPFG